MILMPLISNFLSTEVKRSPQMTYMCLHSQLVESQNTQTSLGKLPEKKNIYVFLPHHVLGLEYKEDSHHSCVCFCYSKELAPSILYRHHLCTDISESTTDASEKTSLKDAQPHFPCSKASKPANSPSPKKAGQMELRQSPSCLTVCSWKTTQVCLFLSCFTTECCYSTLPLIAHLQ